MFTHFDPPMWIQSSLSPLACISLAFEPIITIQINSRVRVVYEELYFLYIVLLVVLSLYLSTYHHLLYPSQWLFFGAISFLHSLVHFLQENSDCLCASVRCCLLDMTAYAYRWDQLPPTTTSPLIPEPWHHIWRKTPQCVAPSSHMLSFLSPETRNTGYSANSSPLCSIIITLSRLQEEVRCDVRVFICVCSDVEGQSCWALFFESQVTTLLFQSRPLLFIILLPHQVQGTQLHAWTRASWWEAEGHLRCSGQWR